jgi:hypothetical protein
LRGVDRNGCRHGAGQPWRCTPFAPPNAPLTDREFKWRLMPQSTTSPTAATSAKRGQPDHPLRGAGTA